jgi:hypothetical protein
MFGYRWSTAWLVLALWGCSKDDTKATPERVASAKASAAPTEESESRPLGCVTSKKDPVNLGKVHGHVHGFALDGTHVYVGSWQLMGGRGDLVRMRKDGGGSQNLSSLALEPRAIVVDDKLVYFTAGIRLMQIPKEGGESKVLDEKFSSQAMADDGKHLYGVPGDYGPYDRLVRTEKASGTWKELDVSDRPEVKDGPTGFSAIAVDGSGVYVTDSGGNRVLKFGFDRGKPTAIGGKLERPYDIAIGGDNLYVSLAKQGNVMMIPKAGGTAKKLGSGLVKNARIATDGKVVISTLAGENEKADMLVLLVPTDGGEPKGVATVKAGHSVEAVGLDDTCAYWVDRDEGTGDAVVYSKPR